MISLETLSTLLSIGETDLIEELILALLRLHSWRCSLKNSPV